MATTMQPPTYTDPSYMALLQQFPPRSIRSDVELDATIATIDSLLDHAELSPAEQDFLDLLSDLVESYERSRVDIPFVTGIQALRHLMEENGLKQTDLADLFGGRSVVSEVLKGKRELSKMHVRRLSARFGLPADVFLA